jgi:hypothetical protein
LALHVERATYDRELQNVSINAAPSFLQVSALAQSFAKDREDASDTLAAALVRVRGGMQTTVDEARKAFDRHVDEQRQATKDDIRTNIADTIKKVFWPLVAAAAILLAVVNVLPFVQSKVRPNVEADVRDAVEREVRRRLAVAEAQTAIPRESAQRALLTRLGRIQAQLDSLMAVRR